MKKKDEKPELDVVYFLYKHERSHNDAFPGLYEVRAAFVEGGKIVRTKKVHEADNLRIASAHLSRYGGAIGEEKLSLMERLDLNPATPMSPADAATLDSMDAISRRPENQPEE